MRKRNLIASNLQIEIAHVFTYKGYTKKQRFIQWFWYMLRHIANIISGIVGLITFGLVEPWWSASISEKILRNQVKFYKELKNNGQQNS